MPSSSIANMLTLMFIHAGCPSCHQLNSVKALKAHNWDPLISKTCKSSAACSGQIITNGPTYWYSKPTNQPDQNKPNHINQTGALTLFKLKPKNLNFMSKCWQSKPQFCRTGSTVLYSVFRYMDLSSVMLLN